MVERQSYRSITESNSAKETERQGKLAWVLSPGFLRGWLQFGVMDRLDKMGLYPDMIIGTSIGAWTGLLAASRVPVDQIEAIQKRDNETVKRMFMQKTFSNRGIYNLDHAIEVLGRVSGYEKFEDLPIPFYVVATRNEDFEPIVFSSGPVLQAVKASVSVPPGFPPVEINGLEYSDGGVTNPAPIDVAKVHGATHVIYVDTYIEKKGIEKSGTVNPILGLALRFLPNIPDTLVTPYSLAKGLSVAWPAYKEGATLVLGVHRQLVKKSLMLDHANLVHVDSSRALGDIGINPFSNESFEYFGDYIERGRVAADYFMPELLKLKASLYPLVSGANKATL